MSRLLVFFFLSRFVFSCGLLLSHAVRSRFIHVDVRSHIVHMMSLTHTHTGLQTCLGSWAQISRVLTAQKHLVLDLSQISLRMKKSDLKLCDTATPRPWSSLCTNWLECVPLCVCICVPETKSDFFPLTWFTKLLFYCPVFFCNIHKPDECEGRNRVVFLT